MHKLWLIIKREYITRVKTKGFVIGTADRAADRNRLHVSVRRFWSAISRRRPCVSPSSINAGGIAPPVVAADLQTRHANGKPQFSVTESIEQPADPDAVQKELRGRINAGALDGYLVIPARPEPSRLSCIRKTPAISRCWADHVGRKRSDGRGAPAAPAVSTLTT